MKNSNVITLDQFKINNYGKPGTAKRDQLEAGYESFKNAALIMKANVETSTEKRELSKKAGPGNLDYSK